MKTEPSSKRPMSVTSMMFWCPMLVAASASRWKRATISGFVANCEWRHLMATRRLIRTCSPS